MSITRVIKLWYMYNTCIIEHYAATQKNEDSFCIIMEKSLYVVVFFLKNKVQKSV